MLTKKRLTQSVKDTFRTMANQLSPENLCGDGEYTNAQAKDRYKKIMVQWWKLEDQIGMKVNQEIIDQWEKESNDP
jgi:hypothetical protein